MSFEQYVADIIAQQEDDGVYFNKRRAIKYINYLDKKCKTLYNNIRPSLTYVVVSPYKSPINKPFKIDGEYTSNTIKWMEDDVGLVGGPFTRVMFNEPDLDSDKQLKEQLFRLGWEPDEWNYKKKE